MKHFSNNEIVEGLRDFSEDKRDRILKVIYMKYFPLIETYVLKNSGTASEAADVFQDAIIIFYEKVRNEDFKMSSSIKTFLYAISRNIWLNKIRRKTKFTLKSEFDDNISDKDLKHLSVLEYGERNEILAQLISTLGPKCKQILILYYYDRLSMKKIANTMQLSSEQVAKNKKSNCLKKLKTVILNSKHLINILT